MPPRRVDWKYVTLRRRLTGVEESIDDRPYWAVFEPNSAALWTPSPW